MSRYNEYSEIIETAIYRLKNSWGSTQIEILSYNEGINQLLVLIEGIKVGLNPQFMEWVANYDMNDCDLEDWIYKVVTYQHSYR